MSKDDFKYLSQEFGGDALDLVKQKGFSLVSVWVVLKNPKKDCQAKKSFVVCWQVIKISNKEHEHFVNVWEIFEMKTMKDYHYLCVKWDVLLLEKFKNSCLRNYGLCPSHYLSTPALS